MPVLHPHSHYCSPGSIASVDKTTYQMYRLKYYFVTFLQRPELVTLLIYGPISTEAFSQQFCNLESICD